MTALPWMPDWHLVSAFGNHLWQSTLVLIPAGLAVFLLRRHRAALRFAVWCAASVKFLVPFSLLIALGGLFDWRPVPEPDALPSVVADVVGQPFSSAWLAALMAPAETPAAPTASVAPAPESPRTMSWGPPLLFAVWAAGALAVGGRWYRRWRHVARMAAAAPIAHEGRECDALRRVQASNGVRMPVTVRLSDEAIEPGIVGILSPSLVWPRRISAHLDDAQMEAIVLHELCHVRRRDNLTAGMHMLVETLFWFHPLVWWMGARLVDERERACDEEVVARGAERAAYAEGILRTCKYCREAPLACVSGVTGSDLETRIEGIMRHDVTFGVNAWRKAAVSALAAGVIVAPIVAGATAERPGPAAVEPDVRAATSDIALPPPVTALPVQEAPQATPSAFVEVRFARNLSGVQNTINAGLRVTPDGRVIVGRNLTFREMIRDAYGLQWRPTGLVIGGPAWLDSERYDFTGVLAQPFAAIPRNEGLPPEASPMLQSLLAERAGLRVRVETADMQVYALTPMDPDGELGSGLTTASTSCVGPFQMVPTSPEGRAAAGPMCTFTILPDVGAEFHGLTMGDLARMLELYPIINRVVIDRTGLSGTWDVSLRFQSAFTQTPGGLLPAQFGQPGVVLLPDAVPAQLGLALEPSVAPVRRVVVEAAERPVMAE